MLTYILLGLVQGLTEFLPISSSGHLIIARYFANLQTIDPLAVDAILQLGTIIAVYIYFFPELWQIARDFFQGRRTMGWAIILGTIPALIVGVIAEQYIDYLRTPLIVAIVLIIGAVLFLLVEYWASRVAEHKKKAIASIKLSQATTIGIAQCLAFVPGFSRSGSTIMGGMLTGFSREAAARFSFYLSLPIITVSGLKQLYDVLKEGVPEQAVLNLSIGTIVSFCVGLACIHFLLSYLKGHSLALFAWYRIVLGVVVLLAL
jgi:undecaprenyl-diphosphatase